MCIDVVYLLWTRVIKCRGIASNPKKKFFFFCVGSYICEIQDKTMSNLRMLVVIGFFHLAIVSL